MIELIERVKDWNNALKEMSNYDIYHTYDYHSISRLKEETPLLIKYEDAHNSICIPLLIRPIPNTNYFDATSVYGYAGPLHSATLTNFDGEVFSTELTKALSSRKIVSIFSRLHPFIENQKEILNFCGNIKYKGEVVYFDLTQTEEELVSKYNKRLKTQINKAKRNCWIKEVGDEFEITIFKNIYEEHMLKLEADRQYFFQLKYFLGLNKSESLDTQFFLVHENDKNSVIGGGIFLILGDFAQYHLSATKEEFSRISPSKMLIDHMRVIAKSKGAKIFNLGGGLGSNQDSLLHFKKLFSKDTKPFYVWNHIILPEIYNDLTKENRNKRSEDYFPAYR